MNNRGYFFFSFIGVDPNKKASAGRVPAQQVLYEGFYYGNKDLLVYGSALLNTTRGGDDPRKIAVNRNGDFLLSIHVGGNPAMYEDKKRCPTPWDVFHEWCTFEDIAGHMGMSFIYQTQIEASVLKELDQIQDDELFGQIGCCPTLLDDEKVRRRVSMVLYRARYSSTPAGQKKAIETIKHLIPQKPKGKKLIPAEVINNYSLGYELFRMLAEYLGTYINEGPWSDFADFKKNPDDDPRLQSLDAVAFNTIKDHPAVFVQDYLYRRLNINHKTLKTLAGRIVGK